MIWLASVLLAKLRWYLVLSSVQFTDYEVVARGYGGQGVRLDRTNEDKMKDVFKQALEDYRKGNSVLVNVLIGKTDFREGSISV